MDPTRFEEMTRQIAAATTRRSALRVLAAGAVVPAIGLFRSGPAAVGAVDEAGVPIFHCKLPGQKCKKKKQCCTQACRRKQCQCRKKGKPCYAPLKGALCCSGRCRNNKCQ